jgi:sulfoxide reductase heme-binding subunit YedZ
VTKWFKHNWRWVALNLFALAVMVNLLWQLTTTRAIEESYNPMLVSAGKWAIRFLLLCLLMTPVNTLLGWRSAIKLRKPAGLWAFEFAVIHFMLNMAGTQEDWLRYPIPDYIAALGVAGLTILTLMAATSARWAQKHMGKWWKRLHRMVYAAGLLVVTHALLESSNKRVVLSDPQAGTEIAVYIAIMIVLLAVRIPRLRGWRT